MEQFYWPNLTEISEALSTVYHPENVQIGVRKIHDCGYFLADIPMISSEEYSRLAVYCLTNTLLFMFFVSRTEEDDRFMDSIASNVSLMLKKIPQYSKDYPFEKNDGNKDTYSLFFNKDRYPDKFRVVVYAWSFTDYKCEENVNEMLGLTGDGIDKIFYKPI